MKKTEPTSRLDTDTPALSRRRLIELGAGALGSALVAPALLSACGSSSQTAASTTTAETGSGGTVQALASISAAARKEGGLTTCAVGTPHSYYVPVIDAFEKYAHFGVDLKNPTYLPSLEVSDLEKAVKTRAKAPYDVVELGADLSATANTSGLLDPYHSTQWADIPSAFKSADGAWSAAYFGVVTFVTNVGATNGFAPTSWEQLVSSPKTPKNSFAMLGDPRSGQPLSGGLGLLTIFSAALANNGGIDNIEPGIDLLAELAHKGVFDPTSSTGLLALPDTAGTRESPIKALYSFDVPLASYSGRANFTEVTSQTPTDGIVSGFYAQAIAKNAVHPQAARLWVEFLQSEQGAEVFLRNGAIPTRAGALRHSGSATLQKLLPSDSIISSPVPSPSQLAAAQKVVDKLWASKLPTS